jgi:DMSO reductase anchor subunit
MMISVQLSVGLLGVDFMTGLLAPGSVSSLQPVWALWAAVIGIVGQAGAFLHLGRPLYAFRAFLGWRTSWMSREILVLGPFAALVAAYAASLWLRPLLLASGLPAAWVPILQRGLGAGALASGVLGTFCSVMIYADTHRPFWSLGRSSLRFFGSVVVLGAAASLSCATAAALWGARVPAALVDGLGAMGAAAILVKLCAELADLRHRDDRTPSAVERSARLMLGALRRTLQLRIAFAVAGLSLLLLLLALPHGAGPVIAGLASTSFALLLVGELLERHLFFRAEAAPAMPGMLGTGFEGTCGEWI